MNHHLHAALPCARAALHRRADLDARPGVPRALLSALSPLFTPAGQTHA